MSPELARQSVVAGQSTTVAIYTGSRVVLFGEEQDLDDNARAGCDGSSEVRQVPTAGLRWQIAGETLMSVNMRMDPPEETSPILTRSRIVCFVNDELSAAALQGPRGQQSGIRRGTIRTCDTNARDRHRSVCVGDRHQRNR